MKYCDVVGVMRKLAAEREVEGGSWIAKRGPTKVDRWIAERTKDYPRILQDLFGWRVNENGKYEHWIDHSTRKASEFNRRLWQDIKNIFNKAKGNGIVAKKPGSDRQAWDEKIDTRPAGNI